MSVDPGEFRATLGHFASGVVVVTGVHRHGPVGPPASPSSACRWIPLMVALAPGKSSTSWPRAAEAESFCANVLAADQEALARTRQHRCRQVCRRRLVAGAQRAAAPPRGALARIDCELDSVHEAGDHYLVVARVVGLETGIGRPLLFYRGGFGGFES